MTLICIPHQRFWVSAFASSIVLLSAALLSACNEQESATFGAETPAAAMAEGRGMAMRQEALTKDSVATPDDQSAEPVRYLAERQYWVIELPETQIQPRWQADVDRCRSGCEVLQANIANSAQAPVSASLQLRIARTQADVLLKALSGPAVTERRIEREDKTLQVVDVEARQKNLTSLRDRLLALQNRAGALKDVLETERELARAQGELDVMNAQRKALANETEKMLLNLEYRPEPSITRTGALQPLADVFTNAGRAFAESLAGALDFLIRTLPWLFIVLPVIWGGWRLVRRLLAWRRGT